MFFFFSVDHDYRYKCHIYDIIQPKNLDLNKNFSISHEFHMITINMDLHIVLINTR